VALLLAFSLLVIEFAFLEVQFLRLDHFGLDFLFGCLVV